MIYECLMLMLMLCESSYARLTPEVLQAPAQPSRRLDVLESAAQQDEIIRGIAATEEEQLEA